MKARSPTLPRARGALLPLFGSLVLGCAPLHRSGLGAAETGAVSASEGAADPRGGGVPSEPAEPPPASAPNLELPTLGGRQLWADVAWCAGWRIQENVLTGHDRLLDPSNVRRAWGTRAACRSELERRRRELGLAPRSPHLVLLLHGLGRSRASMDRLRRALLEAGYEVAAIGYPSTRRSIEEHAETLVELLDGLEGVEHLSLVTHSLGGIVARAALARPGAWKERIALERLVMLAPPSHGSELAALARHVPGFDLLAGPAAVELALGVPEAFPAPPCEFGILAAERAGGRGWNPLLEGAEDGVVSVAEARLAGAADFAVVSGLHGLLVRDRDVIAAVLRFLDSGSFGLAPAGG